MVRAGAEILFPMRVASELRGLRGKTWARLIDRVCQAEDASLEHLAFSLTLIRLCNCLTCHAHAYRALRGCSFCAAQAIRRFRGSDEDLVSLFHRAAIEVQAYLEDGAEPRKEKR